MRSSSRLSENSFIKLISCGLIIGSSALFTACNDLNSKEELKDVLIGVLSGGEQGGLQADPIALNIGLSPDAAEGQENTITLSSDVGAEILSITKTNNEPSFEVSNNCIDKKLLGSNTCEVTVIYNAIQGSQHTEELEILYTEDSSPDIKSYKYSMVGRLDFIGESPLEFSTDLLLFDTAGIAPDYDNQVLTIRNKSNASVYIGSLGTTPDDFTVSSTTCPVGSGALAGGDTCNVLIRFSAITQGERPGSFYVNYGATEAGGNNYQNTVTLGGITEPLPPFNFKTVEVDSTYVTLEWVDVSAFEDSFLIEICEGATCNFTFTVNRSERVIANTEQTTITGLTPFTFYGFRIKTEYGAKVSADVELPSLVYTEPRAPITSINAPVDGTYDDGAVLEFEVNYDDNITVTGIPCFSLDIGGTTRPACYTSGTGTQTIVFQYPVVAIDNDSDGIASGVEIIGGAMIDTNGNDAQSSFLGSMPSLSGIMVNTATGITQPDQIIQLNSSVLTASNELGISWTAPNDNGTAITSYQLQYRENGELEWINLYPNPTGTSVTITGLTANGTYDVRVAANNGLQGEFSNLITKTIVTISSATLSVWYDSADSSTLRQESTCTTQITGNGDAIGCWQDKSGFGNDLIQSDAVKQPIFDDDGFNSLPTVHFNGETSVATGDGFNLTTPISAAIDIFVVESGHGYLFSSANHRIIPLFDNNNQMFWTPQPNVYGLNAPWRSLTSEQLAYYSVNSAGNYIVATDGVNRATGIGTAVSGIYDRLGLRWDGATSVTTWEGYMSEIVVFNSVLSNADRQLVEGYLACKWNFQFALNAGHPYKSTCP